MKWNPDEYGGIDVVRFPGDALWKPDILLFNRLETKITDRKLAYSADENFDARYPVNFVVSSNGEVYQAPPAIVKSSCSIDITW